MSDRTSILLSALAGAVVGGAVGYLLFTEEGRRLREDLEPKLMDLAGEIDKMRTFVKDSTTTARADVRSFTR